MYKAKRSDRWEASEKSRKNPEKCKKKMKKNSKPKGSIPLPFQETLDPLPFSFRTFRQMFGALLTALSSCMATWWVPFCIEKIPSNSSTPSNSSQYYGLLSKAQYYGLLSKALFVQVILFLTSALDYTSTHSSSISVLNALVAEVHRSHQPWCQQNQFFNKLRCTVEDELSYHLCL